MSLSDLTRTFYPGYKYDSYIVEFEHIYTLPVIKHFKVGEIGEDPGL